MKRDVVIEGARDASPAGRERLVRALVEKLGFEERVVTSALAAGRRMRARAGVDEATAIKLKAALEALGAKVVLVTKDPPPPGPPVVRTPDKLTLSALDGTEVDDGATPELSVAKPTEAPPPRPPKTAQAPTVSIGRAHDPFAPPAGTAEDELQLEHIPVRVSKTMAAPPPTMAPLPPPAPVAHAAPSPPMGTVHEPPPADPSSLAERLADIRREPRKRLVAAVGLGLVLGFLPAHLLALGSEDKLDEIRADLTTLGPPTTEAEYDLSMQAYDIARDRMGRVKTRIAFMAGVVWLFAGAAVAYGLWRFVPED